MREHRRYASVLVVALVLALGHATGAAADDPRVSKPLAGTAYTLQAREAQLGIGFQGYGIVDRVTIGTALAGWILPTFTDAFAPNVLVRYRFRDTHRPRRCLGPKGQIDAVAVVDESNEIRIRGTITEKDVTGSYNVVAGMAFYTRRLFSLRVGAGYGRFIIPEVGFVYLETGPVIDFAAFCRF